MVVAIIIAAIMLLVLCIISGLTLIVLGFVMVLGLFYWVTMTLPTGLRWLVRAVLIGGTIASLFLPFTVGLPAALVVLVCMAGTLLFFYLLERGANRPRWVADLGLDRAVNWLGNHLVELGLIAGLLLVSLAIWVWRQNIVAVVCFSIVWIILISVLLKRPAIRDWKTGRVGPLLGTPSSRAEVGVALVALALVLIVLPFANIAIRHLANASSGVSIPAYAYEKVEVVGVQPPLSPPCRPYEPVRYYELVSVGFLPDRTMFVLLKAFLNGAALIGAVSSIKWFIKRVLLRI